MSDAPEARARVAVLMGSDSDYERLEGAFEVLDAFGVAYSAHVLSAHRSPQAAAQFAESAQERGYRVIVCAAGLAAHLAGAVASRTVLPVIGVPIRGGPLQGLDALLSTVQMPPGVPVATVGIGNDRNAALLAVAILALGDKDLAGRLVQYRKEMPGKVRDKDRSVQEKLEAR